MKLPDPDNAGKIIEQEFEIEFVAVDRDEAKDMDAKKAELNTADDLLSHDIEMLKSITNSWSGIEDASGNQIPFNSKNIDQVLNNSWVRKAVVIAYAQAMAGEEARVKN